MPLTIPTQPGFINVRWGLASNTQVFEAPLTKGVQRLGLTGERWMTEREYPPLAGKTNRNRAEMLEWEVFFLELDGRANSFWASPPFRATGSPGSTLTGNLTVEGSGQTGTSIAVHSDSTGDDLDTVLKKGDYVQFGLTNQLVLVTADLVLSNSEQGTMNFKPKIRVPPADEEAIVVAAVRVPMINTVDEVAWDADAFGKFSFRLSGIEVFD